MIGLFREHERIMLAAQIEAVRLVSAYRLYEPLPPRTVAPKEVPSASWLAARDQEEARRGVRLVKFFNSTGEE